MDKQSKIGTGRGERGEKQKAKRKKGENRQQRLREEKN